MKQCYHTIIAQCADGRFVGWVEEVRGAITAGPTLEQCRQNLRESLRLMLQTHRDEARQSLAAYPHCVMEEMEIDEADLVS
jgi:predicted RNase H-like HicB family nuclease